MELVKLVEETLRLEHDLSPNKPIYLVGDSFGGCLALAVAARNPNIDLVVILSNPGPALKKMEEERGIVARFVIGKSLNQGDGSDCAIATENRQTNDFIILDKHIEAPAGLPEKTKFFAYAAENWNAEFFAKVNDDVYVNVDAIGSTLAAHLDKPRVYIGCMKSGEVFSELNNRWYESDWWKFGDWWKEE
ncbi:hypothetical protein ACFE04_018626 [Oxalis oulophora]